MAHAPPRPATSAAGSAAGPGSSTGTRQKEKQAGTFFLGRYRVVDEIGVGGMASVHLARMDGPGGFQKWVAIKRIHPHLVEDDQFVDMFLDEARIAAGINHANVAQVFDLGKDDNTYWIAMEYLHGEPLREIMRRAEEHRSFVSPELAARICSDAAEGLHAAHELRGKNGQLLGLVHRDVTPHNLFLTYDGYTKVVDFGIAKVADRLSQTRAGTLKGKLAYMSPEQVRGAEVDRTTDIFALGVVLWELTTNQRLFRMDTDLDTLEKVQACVVPPPSTIVPDYPVELESVVMKALAKKKQDRFQTARELSRALQNFLMRRGSFVGPEEVATFVRTVFADRIQKREAHLAWASEVTSTINVDQLRAGQVALPGSAEELSLVSYADRDPRASMTGASAARQPPASLPQGSPMSHAAVRQAPPPVQAPRAEMQMAATSLMDDDEDIPTAVATRDHMEEAARALAQGNAERSGPRPAAGDARGGYPAPQQPYRPNAAPPRAQAYAPAPYASAVRDEHTSALPGGAMPGGDDDLGATVALPNGLPGAPSMPEARPPQAGRPAPNKATQPIAQYGGAPQSQAYGQGYAQQQPQAQAYGQGYAMPPASPQYGGQPQAMPTQQSANLQSTMAFPSPLAAASLLAPLPPQSQVETALSLPRPDPAALWLAQQDASAQRPPKRNAAVLIAVGVLTALCVIGIGALVYLKARPVTAEAGALTVPEAPAQGLTAAPAPAPVETVAAVVPSAAPSASAVATAEPVAEKPAAVPTPAAPTAAKTASAPAGTATAAKKEDPGFLTIVCTPFCDDVVDQGRSLGPSPVVRVPVSPGQHRITLKRAGQSNKVISVIVVSGQVTAQRVSMK